MAKIDTFILSKNLNNSFSLPYAMTTQLLNWCMGRIMIFTFWKAALIVVLSIFWIQAESMLISEESEMKQTRKLINFQRMINQ